MHELDATLVGSSNVHDDALEARRGGPLVHHPDGELAATLFSHVTKKPSSDDK